jgi:hypothetical protein
MVLTISGRIGPGITSGSGNNLATDTERGLLLANVNINRNYNSLALGRNALKIWPNTCNVGHGGLL